MSVPKIYESEYKFCLILWKNEPVGSGELVKLCKEELGWSKATTYTVIKRLCERGVVKNENATVTSLVSKEEAEEAEIVDVLERRFSGSVPSFLAAFTRSRSMSESETEELMRLIDSWEEK